MDSSRTVLTGFSRHPGALFHQATPTSGGTLMLHGRSFLEPSARMQQPVHYRSVTLREPLPPDLHPSAAYFYATAVNWQEGTFCVFDTASDMLHGVGTWHLLPSSEAHTGSDVAYVRDTYAFLQRGHSLFHSQCTCVTPRWQVLGLPSKAASDCAVGTNGRARTLEEIARELGVRSLQHTVLAGGSTVTLLDALVRLARLDYDPSTRTISSPECCVPRSIRSAEDIEAAARIMWPRPYVLTFPVDPPMRLKVETALLSLVKDVRVRAVDARAGGGARAVFWNLPYRHLEPSMPLDADVRGLWASSSSSSSSANNNNYNPPPPSSGTKDKKDAKKRKKQPHMRMRMAQRAEERRAPPAPPREPDESVARCLAKN
jgi:hypothetical protein